MVLLLEYNIFVLFPPLVTKHLIFHIALLKYFIALKTILIKLLILSVDFQ